MGAHWVSSSCGSIKRECTLNEIACSKPEDRTSHWRRWGPYLSERSWGNPREDYSADGTAWDYFTHDHARSRTYRWTEDGIAGICDNHQRLCFAFAFWNGVDPILKERLFGVSGPEGNHGEDVKEYYYYLDSTPTHSYMKALYKYPQSPFPYADLVETNRKRLRTESEYELIDTGIFNENRYFDIFIEYAKNDVDDILVRATVINRGPSPATLHLLPTVWFRNTWSWGYGDAAAGVVALGHPHHRNPGAVAGRVQAVAGRCPAAAVHRKRKQHHANVGLRQRAAV